MAAKKQNISDMDAILQFVTESDSEMDLGALSVDWNSDSEQEYEEEDIQDDDNTAQQQQPVDITPPSPLPPPSPNDTSDSLIDSDNVDPSIDSDSDDNIPLNQLITNQGELLDEDGHQDATTVRGRGRGRGRGHGRGRGRGRGRVEDGASLEETWKWEQVAQEDVDEYEVPISFLDTERIKVAVPPNPKVLDFFQMYLTDEIFEVMVNETNRYANQFIELNPDKENNSYVGMWKEITLVEMKCFIGLVLLMGIIHKPSVFSKIMSRNRFQLILKFLHFNDNEDPNYDPEDENRDRLHKVRPLIERLRNRCAKVYSPG